MDTANIIWLAVLNFCGLPLFGLAVGLWIGAGMPGSPVILKRRTHDMPQHTADDVDYEEL